ncbi:MAG: glycosyltransferase family 39 protein [Anaerolineae bacterium]|nr:glycosyltransferase family 39 protein [Anaerolineae bacterium]
MTRILATTSKTESWRPGIWTEVCILALIIAVAAFLRFAWLDTVPPGMTHDEAAFGAEAEMILNGERPVYFSLGYGHEPFYSYFVAAAFAIFGHTLVVMRAVAAAFGLILVPLTYYFARRWFGFHVAWISAAWLAVAFWTISIARQALRGNTLASVWLLTAIFFWEALRASGYELKAQGCELESRPQLATRNPQLATFFFILAGFFLGLTFYTYLPARVTWAVFPVFAIYMLFLKKQRALLKKTWWGFVVMLVVAALIALPIGLYLAQNPGDQVRFDGMMGPIREFFQGKPDRLLRHLWNGVRVFSWVGDTFWVYNIPERPIFDWAGSIVFYAGLLIAIWRWKDARYAFLLLWFPAGMFSGLVTTNEGIFWRTLQDQPVVYIFLAFSLAALLQWAMGHSASNGKRQAWVRVVWLVLVMALLADEGWRSGHTYFVDWPNRYETRNIHNQNMVAAAKYLGDQSESGAVAFSALHPLYYHDPWIFRYVSARYDIADRWFDGRGCVVYPGEGEARFVFSALTSLDVALRGEFEANAALLERRDLRPSDENPYFEVWRWQGGESLTARLATLRAASPLWVSSETQFTRPDLRQPLADGATFGDVMTLIAYRFDQTMFKPDDEVELVTYWRALRTVQEQDDWDTFVHLLDRNGQVIGGADVLDCPPTGWRPGDVAVQVHRFQVGEGVPGETFVEVGVYRHITERSTERLPVLVGGQAVADRVLLAPVQVEGK